jgi:hypothetical protein
MALDPYRRLDASTSRALSPPDLRPSPPPYKPGVLLRTTVRIRIIRIRMKFTGTIRTPLPPDQAISLFTPEGERAWVPGWDPHHHSDTVFTTHGDTIWVVLETGDPHTVRYARVAPGRHAGTVEVRCHPDGTARVTYDLTPLATGALDGFDPDLPDWERRIAEACATSR